jgi:ankyrin repeat protein
MLTGGEARGLEAEFINLASFAKRAAALTDAAVRGTKGCALLIEAVQLGSGPAGSAAAAAAQQAASDEAVALLMARGADAGAPGPDGSSALHVAAQLGRVGAVTALLAGADAAVAARLAQRDSKGRQPLYVAAEKGHAAVASLLLARGADVEAPREDAKLKFPPLYTAAAGGHLAAVKALVAAGAKVDCHTPMASTPLMGAAKFGYVDIIEELLRCGADLHATNAGGYTALHAAAETGKAMAAAALVAHGSKVDARLADSLKTPLMMACGKGHWDAAFKLLAGGGLHHGADHELVDKAGRNALAYAEEGLAEAATDGTLTAALRESFIKLIKLLKVVSVSASAEAAEAAPWPLDSPDAALRAPAMAALSDDELAAHAAHLRKALDEAEAMKARRAERAAAAAAEAQLCIVCLDTRKDTLLVPCGHKCVCQACAARIEGSCPICRMPVTAKVRVYD